MANETPLLQIQNLVISFSRENSWTDVIKDIYFDLYKNEILGIVGESGSGKSVSSLAVLGLLPDKISRISNGKILYQGNNLTQKSSKEFRKIRGKQISMIFQEPMSSLNPSLKCGYQVEEILFEQTNLSKKEIKAEVLSLFEKVKLPNPEKIYNSYPHQISDRKST